MKQLKFDGYLWTWIDQGPNFGSSSSEGPPAKKPRKPSACSRQQESGHNKNHCLRNLLVGNAPVGRKKVANRRASKGKNDEDAESGHSSEDQVSDGSSDDDDDEHTMVSKYTK